MTPRLLRPAPDSCSSDGWPTADPSRLARGSTPSNGPAMMSIPNAPCNRRSTPPSSCCSMATPLHRRSPPYTHSGQNERNRMILERLDSGEEGPGRQARPGHAVGSNSSPKQSWYLPSFESILQPSTVDSTEWMLNLPSVAIWGLVIDDYRKRRLPITVCRLKRL